MFSFVSSVVFIRIVEPFGRGHSASSEHSSASVGSGIVHLRAGDYGVVGVPAVVHRISLVSTAADRGRVPWRSERRSGRVIGAAVQVVAILIRSDPYAPIVLGEFGRGSGQRRLAE